MFKHISVLLLGIVSATSSLAGEYKVDFSKNETDRAAKWYGPGYEGRVRPIERIEKLGVKRFEQSYLLHSGQGSDEEPNPVPSIIQTQATNGGLGSSVVGPLFNHIHDQDQEIELVEENRDKDDKIIKSISSRRLKSCPIANVHVMPNHPCLKLEWNSLLFNIDEHELSATFDIVVTKKCVYPHTNIPCIGFKEVTYRWDIYVKPGGLDKTYITNPVRPLDPSKPKLHYKYFARGSAILVRDFEINGKDVTEYDGVTGQRNRLAAVFHPNPNDCIDINSAVPLSGTGSLPPSSINFCAGSCSGYMLAATNGA